MRPDADTYLGLLRWILNRVSARFLMAIRLVELLALARATSNFEWAGGVHRRCLGNFFRDHIDNGL